MDSERIQTIAKTLRSIASEVETTAIGSSRVEMYKMLANSIRGEASSLESLAEKPTTAEFRHG